MFLTVGTFRNHPTNQYLVEWPGLSPATMKTKRKRTEFVVFHPGKDTWDVANENSSAAILALPQVGVRILGTM
jgi:hypothetical protein